MRLLKKNYDCSNDLVIKLIKKGYSLKDLKSIPYIKNIKQNEQFISTIKNYTEISKDVIKDTLYISSLNKLSALDRNITLRYRNKESELSNEEKLFLKNQDSLIYSSFISLIKEKGWPTEEQIGYQIGKQILFRNFLIHATSYRYYDSTIVYNAYSKNKIPSYLLTYFEEYRLNRKSIRKYLKINDFDYEYQTPFFIHNLTADACEHKNPFLNCPKILKYIEQNRINYDLPPIDIYKKLVVFSKNSKIYNFYSGLYTPLLNISFENDFQKERFKILKEKLCN